MRNLIFVALLGFIVMGFVTGRSAAQSTLKTKQNVAILLFDGVQIIDYTGPYEVLGSSGRRNVFTVSEKGETITTNMGMKVTPTYSFENHPKIDILVLPGGGNIELGAKGRGVGAQLDNARVMKWVTDNAAQAQIVMSVCNGAFFLAKAGLLENLSATTTAGFISSLQKFSPTTTPVYDKRFVDNGKIITTAGLSSGMDGAFHLIERLDGKGWAKATALGIEYNWQPESDFARGSVADMKLPNNLGTVFTRTSVPVEMNGNKTDWEETWMITTDASPAETLAALEKIWSNEAGWTKTGADKSRTNWKLTERTGETWNGWASVKPAGENGKLLVSLGISAQKKKAAGE